MRNFRYEQLKLLTCDEEMKLTRLNSQNVKRFLHYRIAFLVLIKANWSKKKNLDLMEQKLRANSKRIKCSHFKNTGKMKKKCISANINHLSTQDMRQKFVI